MPLLFARHGRRRMGAAYQAGIHLNFATGVHYVKPAGGPATIAPFTSLFTFTGGNQSMYRGASGLLVASATNTPRIEYDANGNLLGLLIEGARTNAILQSADQTTTWTITAILAFGSGSVSNSNGTLDPAGTNTADLLVPNTSNTTHNNSQTFTSTATSWTLSVFVKPSAAYTKFGFAEVNATATWASFNCSGAGSVIATHASASGTISAVGNGWYRCTMTYTGSAASHIWRMYPMDNSYAAGSPASYSYAGDGTSGFYVWGAQAEAGAFASSYIPTTTGSVARTVDVAQRTVGTECSSTVGTIFAQLDAGEIVTTNSRFFCLDDGSGNNRFAVRFNSSLLQAYTSGNAVADGGATTANTTTINTMMKAASAYGGTNDLASCLNGGTVATDGSVTALVGTLNRFSLFDPSGGDKIFGHIRRLDYWPERKANAELQRLTA